MPLQRITDLVRDTLHVQRVFGEPVERDGTTVIPVALVGGGGGAGSGQDSAGDAGEGGGFGLGARPAGAYVIRDGAVRWVPAVDVNRLVATVAAVVVAGLLRRRRR
ncbi:spore germination protein GerW family protein [Egicoccus halophilus]|uniref:Sporulation protein YtfJ (Spore_YtfJ) n=1 Tax=Egicoccus halophilus TaxID=1670830 RepID=A0A8J3A5B1_9ACTN|nr:spore germination protein GerW family protein [Egicoccus halophilus]GGI03393.1 hypothetical protein GCM10011354_03810 [Egicoccus halophilus]